MTPIPAEAGARVDVRDRSCTGSPTAPGRLVQPVWHQWRDGAARAVCAVHQLRVAMEE